MRIEPPLPDAAALERDLPAYFAGLARAVSEGRHELSAVTFTAAIEGDGAEMAGTASAFDAFETGRALVLHVRARAAPCPGTGQHALLVRLSPRASGAGDPVWRELDAVAADFRCR